MAVRFSCVKRYGDRWCFYHGTCRCVGLSEDGGREWAAPGSNPECKLHGVDSKHPYRWAKVKRRG